MKKILSTLVALAFIPALAFGQVSSYVRNDTATTVIQNTNLKPSKQATDSKGRSFVSSTLEAGSATVGSIASITTSIVPGTAATNLGKAEDAPSASGDTLVAAGGVRNTNYASLTSNDGDYGAIALTAFGSPFVSLDANMQGSAASPVHKEDNAAADADGVMTAGFVREDALTQNTSATGDHTYAKTDSLGRQITTFAPEGDAYYSCSSANTGTTDVAIKAAVASKRIYVMSITCSNNSAVASQLSIKDGTTLMAVGGVGTLAATGGGFAATFPVPLRGAVGTALNFAMTTNATSTICCAQGYIAVN